MRCAVVDHAPPSFPRTTPAETAKVHERVVAQLYLRLVVVDVEVMERRLVFSIHVATML